MMKEHQQPYWDKKIEHSYAYGERHGKGDHPYEPTSKEPEHEEAYRQGYHEGVKTRRGNR